tara:strand:- start:131 stop:709 length:579 start_codon:yes stop_codon:yes gene_type:complete
LENNKKMRIISGKFKGKFIKFLKNDTTRPLRDSVKENIFNILKHSNKFKIDINNAKILDFYSGVGSFGLECLSRGAKKVIFVERDKRALQILKKNVTNLLISKNSVTLVNAIQNALDRNKKEKIDIFFFDPPFLDKNFLENLKIITNMQIFENNHIVIIHREKNSNDNFENILNVLFSKNYGRSKIIFGRLI